MTARLRSPRRWRSLVPATALIALTVALAVPVVQAAIGRASGLEVARTLWDAICQPSEAKQVVGEARAMFRPAVRASMAPQSLGPLDAAPMSAFPVSTPPAPHVLR